MYSSKFSFGELRLCDVSFRNRHLGGRIPNVLAYSDGSLIKIMKPTLEDNILAYIGRKSFASLNVLVVGVLITF